MNEKHFPFKSMIWRRRPRNKHLSHFEWYFEWNWKRNVHHSNVRSIPWAVGYATVDRFEVSSDHRWEWNFYFCGTRTIHNLLFAVCGFAFERITWKRSCKSMHTKWSSNETRFYAFYLLRARTLVWFIFLAITYFTMSDGTNNSNNNSAKHQAVPTRRRNMGRNVGWANGEVRGHCNFNGTGGTSPVRTHAHNSANGSTWAVT